MNNKLYKLQIPLQIIIFLVLIWCLVISGMPTKLIEEASFPIGKSLINILLALIITVGTFAAKNQTIDLFLNKIGALVGVLVTSIISIFSFGFLTRPIGGDEVYHYGKSLVGFNIPYNFDKVFPYINLNSIPLIWTTGIANILICSIFFGLLFIILRKYDGLNKLKYLIFFFLCLVFISTIERFEVNALDPHPLLRTLPLWISQIIFGINSIGPKLIGLFSYTFSFSLFISAISSQRSLSNLSRYNKIAFILIAIFAGTYPLLAITSLLVEPSIWASLAWIFTATNVINYEETQDVKFLLTGYTLTILMALMRPTSIVLIPIYLLFIFFERKLKERKNVIYMLSISVVLIIQILGSIVIGHPAYEEKTIQGTISSLDPILLINYSKSLISAIGITGFILISLGIYMFCFSTLNPAIKEYRLKFLSINRYLIFLPLIWTPLLFLGVKESLHSLSRYFAEYVGIALILFVIFSASNFFANERKEIKSFIFIVFFIFSGNLVYLQNISSDLSYLYRGDLINSKRFHNLAIYPITKGIQFIRHNELIKEFIILDTSLNFSNNLNFVLAGSSKNELIIFQSNQNKLKNILSIGNEFDKYNNILNSGLRYVLLINQPYNEIPKDIREIKKVLIEKGKIFHTIHGYNGHSISILKLIN